jgi:hypothetical protein
MAAEAAVTARGATRRGEAGMTGKPAMPGITVPIVTMPIVTMSAIVARPAIAVPIAPAITTIAPDPDIGIAVPAIRVRISSIGVTRPAIISVIRNGAATQ